MKLDDDSDDDEESKEGQEGAGAAASADPVAALPCVVVEEKRPQLTQEELEAKQGLSVFCLWFLFILTRWLSIGFYREWKEEGETGRENQ